MPRLKKDCFRATPKPAREPRALPGCTRILYLSFGAESRNLSSDSSFDRSSAHDETSTAARTHRVRRNMSRRIGAAAARSFYFDAKNNVASTHALSIHRSGMLAAAHTQKASRNLQSSAPRLAMRTGVFGGQHQTTPTTLRDPLRRS